MLVLAGALSGPRGAGMCRAGKEQEGCSQPWGWLQKRMKRLQRAGLPATMVSSLRPWSNARHERRGSTGGGVVAAAPWQLVQRRRVWNACRPHARAVGGTEFAQLLMTDVMNILVRGLGGQGWSQGGARVRKAHTHMCVMCSSCWDCWGGWHMAGKLAGMASAQARLRSSSAVQYRGGSEEVMGGHANRVVPVGPTVLPARTYTAGQRRDAAGGA